MFLVPFVCGPLPYIADVYQCATIQLDEEKKWTDVSQTVKARPMLKKFFNELSLKSNLKIIHTVEFSAAEGLHTLMGFEANEGFGTQSGNGMNYITNGDAYIVLNTQLYNNDRDLSHWIIKFETLRIKNNNHFLVSLVAIICSTVTAIFAISTMSIIPASLTAFFIARIAERLYIRYSLIKTDNLTIEKSTNEELKGAIRLFKINKILLLKKIPKKFEKFISQEGSLWEPSMTSRIQKIENVLRQRKVVIDASQEQEKINRLVQLLTPPA